MLEGKEKVRAEVVACRVIRTGQYTDKQVKGWRVDLGDGVVDKLLKEQGA